MSHVSSRCWMGRHGDSCRVCYDACSCDCHAPGDADAHYVEWLIAGCPIDGDTISYDEPFFTVSREPDDAPSPTADEIIRDTREAMTALGVKLEHVAPEAFADFNGEVDKVAWRLARAVQLPRAMLYPKIVDPDEDGYRYRRAILLRQWRRRARTWLTLRSRLR